MAVEKGTRRTGDSTSIAPQSKQVENSVEEEINHDEERNPEKGVELPLHVVSEHFSHIMIVVGVV